MGVYLLYIDGIDRIGSSLRMILGSGRIVIACIGSPLRRDDRAGLVVYERLRDLNNDRIRVVECIYGLENCYTDIIGFKPDKIILIDSVFVEGVKPGSIILGSYENIRERIGIATTHNIPLTLVLKGIVEQIGVREIYVLGVVVKDIGFGEEISREVDMGVRKIIDLIREVLSSLSQSS